MSVFGRTAYGSQSFEGSGPTLVSSYPATGATSTGTDVLTYFTITSEAGIDVNLLNVYDGTTPIILGGAFVGSFNGTITAGAQDCEVVVSTYPTWSDAIHTVNIDATDLAGTQSDLSYTFNTSAGGTAYTADVADTVTVSDAVVPLYAAIAGPSETVTISEALAELWGVSVSIATTVTVSEGEANQIAFSEGPSETVTFSEALTSSKATSEGLAETVTVSEAVDAQLTILLTETVTVSESLAALAAYTDNPSDIVTLSETLIASEGETRAVSETVTVSDALQSSKGTADTGADTVTVSDALQSSKGTAQGVTSEIVSVADSLAALYAVNQTHDRTVTLSEGLSVGEGVGAVETITVSDSVLAIFADRVFPAEAVVLSEVLISSAGYHRGVSDPVSLSDALNVQEGYAPTPTETVTSSESLTFAGVYTQPIAESVPIFEIVLIGESPAVVIVEPIPLTESLTQHAVMAAPLSETVPLQDDTDVRKNQEVWVECLPGTTQGQTFRINLDVPLSWSPRGKNAAIHSLEIESIDGGVPAKILGLERLHDTYQTGYSGYLVYDDQESQTSNVFSFPGEAALMAYDPTNKYLEIITGPNQGFYKIKGLVNPAGQILLELEDDLPLLDPLNGYVQGLLEYVGTTVGPTYAVYEYRLADERITTLDPIVELLYLERRDGYLPGTVAVASYNTITITMPKEFFWPATTVRLFATVRVSPKVDWKLISGVTGFMVETSKLTGGKTYKITAESLRTTGGQYVDIIGYTLLDLVDVHFPRIIWAESIGDEGMVLVQYDQPMQPDDGNLFNPADYSITGPTTVGILGVFAQSDGIVALHTTGLGEGDYTITVSTSTPKDVAGNPLDPTFNTAVFTAAPPLAVRSIFTDKGPIAKPPLTIQSGTAATLDTFTTVTLTGASLTSDHVGKYLTLTDGSSTNAGTYRVSSVLSSTQAKLQASFTLPDTTSFSWELFDPQNGLLADDPSDVTVKVNGVEVTPDAVIGLMGQIVLPSAPAAADDVKVDYSWCCNPTVDFRRLNSKEFRLNAWGRDQGYPHDVNQHRYRYNNVLVRPSDYEPLDPRAILDQPEQRELHYRAYERRYTPVLNDPTLLVLNTPIHRIAYPPAQRLLSEEFVAYNGIGLPESQVVNPWVRRGSGTATSSGGYLTIEDDSTGPFPTGQPLFWTRNIDVTFPHVFAMSWRFQPMVLTELDGVFSGIAAGYSDDIVACVVGFLDDGGVKKLGVLKRGYGDDPSSITAWTGGLDSALSPTELPADFDWENDLHSYRILRDRDGNIFVYVDGDTEPTLRVTASELPFLEELNAPFDEIQGAFFGSLSRPARSISRWDFCRYLIQPTNPVQTSAASFVSYEANVVPEADAKPWTLVGYHGTATILSTDFLLLDNTSASDATGVGLIGGDYRAYYRFEPLLSYSSELVLDAKVQGTTHTHGLEPNGLMMAIDDGTRLMQVSFITDRSTPLFSYGGRSLPGDFSPYVWGSDGTQTGEMVGRVLRITDTSTTDGLVYYYDDTNPSGSDDRVISVAIDYILEFRCRVNSYTVDGSGFAGAFGQVYDGTRAVGLLLQEVAGVKYASFHSDGVVVAQTAFDWGDGEFHTYRLTKSTTGDLVSLFVDGQFVDSLAYSSFASPGISTTGQVTFGSSTPASMAAESVVDWAYCNTWRLRSDLRYYVGIWKGTSYGTLRDYHLPIKAFGTQATVLANALGDGNAAFISAGVVAGDMLIVDDGPNAGVYEVAAVTSETSLTLTTAWPLQPSEVVYRIAEEADWTTQHKWRLVRDSQGTVTLLRDTASAPLIQIGYTSLDLPISGVSGIRTVTGGLPAVVFGSFESGSLSQSYWDYVRYGITRSPTELRIVPHHEVLNQWNVMHSPENLFTTLSHSLTDYKSSSTGQPPKTYPDFLEDPALTAFTMLNEGTPIVPLTQTFEVRAPFPVTEFVSGLNRPEDVLNSDVDFVLNDGAIRYRLIVPNDVLYSSLDIIEQSTGEQSLITPFSDGCGCGLQGMKMEYTKDVCLTYEGDVLPEDDTTAPTPWSLVSDNPAEVSTTVFSGILTYSTGSGGTKTVYRNDTSLPDAPSLRTEAQFRMRVLNDGTLGTDDTQIRAGLSAPNLTVALAFITTPLAERYILVIDLNNGNVMGSITFDYLDGNYHTYHIVRDPGAGVVQVSIS